MLFLAYLAATVIVVVALMARYVSSRTALGVLTGLAIWFTYIGLLAYNGVLSNITSSLPASRPEGLGIVFVLAPVFLFVTLLVILPMGGRAALTFPVWILIGAQVFRFGLELLLHQVWVDGLVPKMLTYEGANVDILIGLSAPIVAWVSTRGRLG